MKNGSNTTIGESKARRQELMANLKKVGTSKDYLEDVEFVATKRREE